MGRLYLPYLERIGAAGPCQFAYRKKRGLRDALAYLLLSWLLILSKCEQVALYCSNVSSAFDRVSADRLLYKLKLAGVHASSLAIHQSWLKKQGQQRNRNY